MSQNESKQIDLIKQIKTNQNGSKGIIMDKNE